LASAVAALARARTWLRSSASRDWTCSATSPRTSASMRASAQWVAAAARSSTRPEATMAPAPTPACRWSSASQSQAVNAVA
jgi:hypothetical protein